MTWPADMTDDEREVALFPVGHRWSIIVAGYTKWSLAACRLDGKAQLEFLEGLSSLAETLGARVLHEIKPCSAETAEIIETALQNDGDEKLSRSFGILTGREVFAELLRLNPSWLRAIKIFGCGYGAAKAA